MTYPNIDQEFAEIVLETDRGRLTALSRSGTGVPIVVVHGVMADAFSWQEVVRAVSPERPALVLNRRGRAPSAQIGDDYGVETEVADLLRWLDTLQSPVDLVGHSYGGLIAVEAVRRGAQVRSLVLYEPVAPPFGVEAQPLLDTAVRSGDLDAAVEIINVDLSGYSHEHVAALRSGPAWPKLMELAHPAGPELTAINRYEWVTPGSWLTPTELIAGELSRHRPPYGPSTEIYRQALGIEKVAILEGQDHLAHVTAPLALAGAIESGLGE